MESTKLIKDIYGKENKTQAGLKLGELRETLKRDNPDPSPNYREGATTIESIGFQLNKRVEQGLSKLEAPRLLN